jgi:hypothetical protein
MNPAMMLELDPSRRSKGAHMTPLSRGLLAIAAVACLGVTPAFAQWNPTAEGGGARMGATATDPAVASDGGGGVFVAWVGEGGTRAQHLNAWGEAQWTPGGVLVGTTNASLVKVVGDGAGGAIVVFVAQTSAIINAVQAQRVSAAGAIVWGSAPVAVSANSYAKYELDAIADGAGGVFATWTQTRLVHLIETNPLVGVQHVLSGGSTPWGVGGLSPNNGVSLQSSPTLARDGADGVIVTWTDNRTGGDLVYSQRYTGAGTPLWTAGGLAAAGLLVTGQETPRSISDGAGGVYITWSYSPTLPYIYAQRLDGNGAQLWSLFAVRVVNTGIGTVAVQPVEPALASDGAGGIFVSWSDQRAGDYDIYAQRLNSSGFLQWPIDGVPIATGAGDQRPSNVIADGAGGAVVVWEDQGPVITSDIRAQRISAAGATSWAANGVAVSHGLYSLLGHALAADPAGNPIIAWDDGRTGVSGSAMVQRIDHSSFLGNPTPRMIAVKDVPNDQGLHLRMSWTASALDNVDIRGISSYDIQRWNGAGWLLYDTIQPGPFQRYSRTVLAIADSTAPASPYTLLRVVAIGQSGTPDQVWISAPDSGRSVDNLAPPPATLNGNYATGATQLTWAPSAAPDLAGYRVYRGSTPEFTPDATTCVATVATPGYTDAIGRPAIYKLTVVDLHGNESAPTAWQPAGVEIPVDGPASELAFAPPGPNPARNRVTLAFTLPVAGAARVTISDVEGRTVRTLAAGDFPAGVTTLAWDLRDTQGRNVRAGVYFARVSAGARELTRRVQVVR